MAGYFKNESMLTCSKCAIGYYQPSMAKGACIPIPAGYSSNGRKGTTDLSNATICYDGMYSPSNASAYCTSADPGYYVFDAPSECQTMQGTTAGGCTMQWACDPGESAPNSGSSSCTDCAPGSFSTTTASTTCTLCAKGFYQPNSGHIECLECPEGETTEEEGSTECIDECVISSWLCGWGVSETGAAAVVGTAAVACLAIPVCALYSFKKKKRQSGHTKMEEEDIDAVTISNENRRLSGGGDDRWSQQMSNVFPSQETPNPLIAPELEMQEGGETKMRPVSGLDLIESGDQSDAPPPPPPPPPEERPKKRVSVIQNWEEFKDEMGKSYFHNSTTGETRWDRPMMI